MPYKDPDKRRAFQRASVRETRSRWLAANGPCVKCGSATELQVDHIDPEQKVSHRIWSWSATRREQELAKCQVLCVDCHKDKTRLSCADAQSAAHGTPEDRTAQRLRRGTAPSKPQ